MDTVDASRVSPEFLEHTYYGENWSVISDQSQVLHIQGVPPGLKEMAAATGSYWVPKPR